MVDIIDEQREGENLEVSEVDNLVRKKDKTRDPSVWPAKMFSGGALESEEPVSHFVQIETEDPGKGRDDAPIEKV